MLSFNYTEWVVLQVSWRVAYTRAGVPRLMQPPPLACQALGPAQGLRCWPVKTQVLRLAGSLDSQDGQGVQRLVGRRHCLCMWQPPAGLAASTLQVRAVDAFTHGYTAGRGDITCSKAGAYCSSVDQAKGFTAIAADHQL